jgi:CRISPR-associated endonuclease/helicase Cas3
MNYYAHSVNGLPPEVWQTLKDHLNNVSKLAANSADCFGARNWAAILGDNHDLGKGTLPWQSYLRRANNVVDEFAKFYEEHPSHAAIGAQWLYQNSKEAGKLLAYCIAGHHGGLPNWNDSATSALVGKLDQQFPQIEIPHPIQELPNDLPLQID